MIKQYSESLKLESLKWHYRFLDLAEHISYWSKDPSTKCGAVIIRPNRTIASVGFNGFPRGVSDAERLYNDREIKYSRVIHAEQNALINSREDVTGCSIYIHGPGFTPTCVRCAVHLIQAGIKNVFAFYTPIEEGFKLESVNQARQLFDEAMVNVCLIVKETGDVI
jgi:dCMP deaminase